MKELKISIRPLVARVLSVKTFSRHFHLLLIVFLSFAVCILISFLHIKQQYVMQSSIDTWSKMRHARNAVSRGMVMILEGNSSVSENDILVGVALAKQGTDFYKTVIKNVYFHDTSGNAASWTSDLSVRSSEFSIILEEIAKKPFLDRKRALALRISYQNLDRAAEYGNAVAQRLHIDLSMHNDRMFIATLWVCAGILIFILGAALTIAAGEYKAKRELFKQQLLLQTIIDSTPSPVYAFDKTDTCILTNAKHAEIFRKTKSEVIGKKRSDLNPDPTRITHSENDQAVFFARKVLTFTEKLVIDSAEHTFITAKVPLLDDDGGIFAVGGVSTDITEITAKEEALSSALEEKEILIKELYHRTKNNMQIIHSMLRLQSGQSSSDEVKSILRSAENRIYAMALVHQKLYEGHDLSRLSLKDYIGDFAESVILSLPGLASRIKLQLDIDDIQLLLDTAIPCGLVLNELITNSLKHAFPERRSGSIRISAHIPAEGTLDVEYSDDGIGVAEGFGFRDQKTLGMKIIFAIVEQQMKGKAEFSSSGGLRCRFTMRTNLYSQRV